MQASISAAFTLPSPSKYGSWVKRWQDAKMALRWTGAAMLEAAKGFRRLKAHKQLPVLRAALAAHQAKHASNPDLEHQAKAA